MIPLYRKITLKKESTTEERVLSCVENYIRKSMLKENFESCREGRKKV